MRTRKAIACTLLGLMLGLAIRLQLLPVGCINSTGMTTLCLPKSTETVVPKRKPLNKNDGISVCLIFKDDNSRLIEWIAYHYQMLPMRTLVVGVDHTSTTLPHEILERWNHTYMNVYAWNSTDFTPPAMRNHPTNGGRIRQQFFHEACFTFLQQQGKKWVSSIDIDEYIGFNRFSVTDPHWEVRNATLSKAKTFSNLTRNDHLVLARTRIPEIGSHTTILDFIQQEQANPPWDYQSCVPMTRLMFGAVENPDVTADIQSTLPPDFVAKQFDTLRFFQHKSKENCRRNCKGKALLDLERIPPQHLIHPYTMEQQQLLLQNNTTETTTPKQKTSELGPHAPVLECNETLIPSYLHSVLRVHHYLGSEEAFFARKDYRGVNRDKKFNWYKDLRSLPEKEMSHWLVPFVESVGEQAAAKLLHGAGDVEHWRKEKMKRLAAS